MQAWAWEEESSHGIRASPDSTPHPDRWVYRLTFGWHWEPYLSVSYGCIHTKSHWFLWSGLHTFSRPKCHVFGLWKIAICSKISVTPIHFIVQCLITKPHWLQPPRISSQTLLTQRSIIVPSSWDHHRTLVRRTALWMLPLGCTECWTRRVLGRS